jgi:uncharacterized membrane protein YfcA
VHPGVPRDILTVLLGLFTGLFSALFGVGGAVISTPGIRALGATAFVAVGTTLPSIIPSAMSGTLRYVRERMIDWRVVGFTAATGIAASIGGSLLSHVVPGDGHWLMILTAALLGATAARMARAPRPVAVPAATAEADSAVVSDSAAGPRRDNPLTLATVGLLAGGMSGLLGVGGGIVLVPAFTEWVRLPLKTAIATSLACVGAFAIPGTITHTFLGDIDWRFAVLLALGVIPGARVGAALAIRTRDVRLRRVVAAFLAITAVIYATGEILALLRK